MQAECFECQRVKICCKRICLFHPKEGSDQISTVSSFLNLFLVSKESHDILVNYVHEAT